MQSDLGLIKYCLDKLQQTSNQVCTPMVKFSAVSHVGILSQLWKMAMAEGWLSLWKKTTACASEWFYSLKMLFSLISAQGNNNHISHSKLHIYLDKHRLAESDLNKTNPQVFTIILLAISCITARTDKFNSLDLNILQLSIPESKTSVITWLPAYQLEQL